MAIKLSDQTQNMILSAVKYNLFKNSLAASHCQRCPLHSQRAQIVVDRGDPSASVLFIGEAPGRNEDAQGKAFVGRAGKLLDEMLRELGFDTEKDALIANINKCRPPDNRRPTPEEVAACLPYLHKQIDLVAPKIIALLGATALKSLFPEKKSLAMSGEVGRFFDHGSRPEAKFIVLYHPAYILRDPRKKPLMKEHLTVLVKDWRRMTAKR